MKKQSKITVLLRMVKLVKPLTGFMLLAILMGTLGFLCAQFIPILGGYAVLHGLKINIPLSINFLWIALIGIALLRAVLKYAEQRTNHYIAFTLLAIIRDRVFQALRRLCPARLEGRDKGDLISLIIPERIEIRSSSDLDRRIEGILRHRRLLVRNNIDLHNFFRLSESAPFSRPVMFRNSLRYCPAAVSQLNPSRCGLLKS